MQISTLVTPLLADAATNSTAAVGAAFGVFAIFIWIFFLGLITLTIIACWKIAAKAGYHGAWSLLQFVPFANFVVLLVFAFSEWPIEQKLKDASTQLALAGKDDPYAARTP